MEYNRRNTRVTFVHGEGFTIHTTDLQIAEQIAANEGYAEFGAMRFKPLQVVVVEKLDEEPEYDL